jgi:GNAT superfamily N-acetyltransferase
MVPRNDPISISDSEEVVATVVAVLVVASDTGGWPTQAVDAHSATTTAIKRLMVCPSSESWCLFPNLDQMSITYQWRGDFDSAGVEALHAEGFGHQPVTYDWKAQVTDHSLGWVCALEGHDLVGFVNVAWDGAGHAFIIDTLVARRARRQGIGKQLVAVAVENARAAGCEWLHVDFDDHLKEFYFEACRFSPTNAGLIAL